MAVVVCSVVFPVAHAFDICRYTLIMTTETAFSTQLVPSVEVVAQIDGQIDVSLWQTEFLKQRQSKTLFSAKDRPAVETKKLSPFLQTTRIAV